MMYTLIVKNTPIAKQVHSIGEYTTFVSLLLPSFTFVATGGTIRA